MTLTGNELDLTILDDMDFEIACEYSIHSTVSPTDAPAEWVVIKKTIPCSCDNPSAALWCNDCLEQRKKLIASGGFVYCSTCYRRMDAWGSLISVERISGRPQT